MRLTDTTANALTTTSFLGAATAAAVQYNELVRIEYTPFPIEEE